MQELGLWRDLGAQGVPRKRGTRTALALRVLFQGKTEQQCLGNSEDGAFESHGSIGVDLLGMQEWFQSQDVTILRHRGRSL